MRLPEGKPVHHGPGQRKAKALFFALPPCRGESLVDGSHCALSRIAECAWRIAVVEKCGRCGRQLISSSCCCRDLTASQPASLRGGVAVLWEDRGGTAAPPGSVRKRKCWIRQPRLWNDCRHCEFEGRQTQQQALWVTSDERQRTRPFAIEDGLGKRCGRVRPWEHGSRCTTTYLTRFICTVVEASHRGGGGLRRDVFPVQASRPDASSRGTSHPSPLGAA